MLPLSRAEALSRKATSLRNAIDVCLVREAEKSRGAANVA
jgi:hypothetical protein